MRYVPARDACGTARRIRKSAPGGAFRRALSAQQILLHELLFALFRLNDLLGGLFRKRLMLEQLRGEALLDRGALFLPPEKAGMAVRLLLLGSACEKREKRMRFADVLDWDRDLRYNSITQPIPDRKLPPCRFGRGLALPFPGPRAPSARLRSA